MKILVLGGMHGNEPLGPEVCRLFRNRPQKNVDVLIANELAYAANCRFVGADLNRSFPGEADSSEYEPRRAAELIKLCKGYDLVLDFHNTYCPGNDCSFVGESGLSCLEGISSVLGLGRIVIADYDCINKYVPNCISVEVSMQSPVNDASLWYEKISRLAVRPTWPSVSKRVTMERYRFVYRMTLRDRDAYELEKQAMQAFSPIDDELACKLGVESPAYPIFIQDAFTPYNYGGLLNRI